VNGSGVGRMPPTVVKLGGRSLETPEALETFVRQAATLQAPLVLVHGGGAEVSTWCARLGVGSRFLDGLRVTDDATLEIATAVLAGLANKRLVATLRAAGADAVGLSALDGGIARVVPHPDRGRLGRVGAVEAIDARLIASLLAAGRLPVLASIGALDGALLNLNADDVATALAAELGGALVLLCDTPGLRLGGQVVPRLTTTAARELVTHPDVIGGMRHKLATACDAVENGARFARIAQWGPGVTFATLLAHPGPGTTLVPAVVPSTPSPLPIGGRS